MSSSQLFLGLPIALLVLYFELNSGFHSAAFINHLSLGDVAILSAKSPFHFLCLVPASNLLLSQFFLWLRLCFLCSLPNLLLLQSL